MCSNTAWGCDNSEKFESLRMVWDKDPVQMMASGYEKLATNLVECAGSELTRAGKRPLEAGGCTPRKGGPSTAAS
jgi:hypothetical protein